MKAITRKASASWKGGGKAIAVKSMGLQPVGFPFGGVLSSNSGTASAELIAAAHANSFLLSLFKELGPKAVRAGKLLTTAVVNLELLTAGWTVMNVHLNVIATLPHTTQSAFIDATVRAKTSCMVSRLLRTNISMNAKLET